MYYACSQILLRANYFPTTPVPPKPGRNGQKPNRVRPGPCPPHPILTSTKYTHQSRIRARPRHRGHTPGFASGPNRMKLFEIQIQPWGLVWTIDQDLGLPPMSVACPPPPTALALPPAKPSFSRAGGSRGDKDRPRMHPRRRASTAPRAPPVCTHFLSFVL